MYTVRQLDGIIASVLVSPRLCSPLPLLSERSSSCFVLRYPVTLHTEQNTCLIMLSPSLFAFLSFVLSSQSSKLFYFRPRWLRATAFETGQRDFCNLRSP